MGQPESMPRSSSAEELAQLIADPDAGTGRGSILYAATRARRQHRRQTAQFLDALAESPRPTHVTAQHPKDAVRGRAAGRRGRGLDDSDRLWLSRLPSDPAQIGFDDAVELATLAATVPRSADSDWRLVQSIWRNVDDYHSRHVAEARLANVNRTAAPVPEGALNVIAEAVLDDEPGLHPDLVAGRARDLLAQAVATRDARQEEAVANAQMRVWAVDAVAADRQTALRGGDAA
jgi:hypothetical protein